MEWKIPIDYKIGWKSNLKGLFSTELASEQLFFFIFATSKLKINKDIKENNE